MTSEQRAILVEALEVFPELAEIPPGEWLSYLGRRVQENNAAIEVEQRGLAEDLAAMKLLQPYMEPHPQMTTTEALAAMRLVEGPEAECVRQIERWIGAGESQ